MTMVWQSLLTWSTHTDKTDCQKLLLCKSLSEWKDKHDWEKTCKKDHITQLHKLHEELFLARRKQTTWLKRWKDLNRNLSKVDTQMVNKHRTFTIIGARKCKIKQTEHQDTTTRMDKNLKNWTHKTLEMMLRSQMAHPPCKLWWPLSKCNMFYYPATKLLCMYPSELKPEEPALSVPAVPALPMGTSLNFGCSSFIPTPC